METSASGKQARSAIIRVTINSNGCSSPICRLPISRISTIKVVKTISVLIKVTAIQILCTAKGFLCKILLTTIK